MKQKTKIWMAAIALSLVSLCSFSQEEQPATPRWVSDKGYWVIESNIHSPLDQIIWFYNNDNMLVYKETVTGIKLDLTKRRVKMKLKKILDESIESWEANKIPEENKHYVAAIFK